jgi:hypothetical protein
VAPVLTVLTVLTPQSCSPISAAEFQGVIEQQRARIAAAVRDLGIVLPQ